jgi:DNA-binding IclR family transcriptional regulator
MTQRDKIITAIRNCPGIRGGELSRSTGVPRYNIHKILQELQDIGIIRRQGNTRAATWWPEPQTQEEAA